MASQSSRRPSRRRQKHRSRRAFGACWRERRKARVYLSHYDVESNKHNRAAIATANAKGFTINLSANNLDHADKLTDLGIGPVATVLPHDFDARKTTTPQGRIVAQCPATYRDDVTCKTCGLCQKQSRRVIVGFPAHGNSKKKASAVAA